MIKFCSLFSGSSGNALFLKCDSTSILIDAGLSGKKTIEAMTSIGEDPSNLSGILISHEHIDHTRGAGIISRKFGVPIYANEKTWKAMEGHLGTIDLKNKLDFITGEKFGIGDIYVNPFNIPHDAAEPVGFNFFVKNKKVTVATDIGHININLLECFEKSDLILLESNYDPEMVKMCSYPWKLKQRILSDIGHLSNANAGKVVSYLTQKGTERFLLGHLSKENNFPELAYQTVCNVLSKKDIQINRDILLNVASRDAVGQVVNL